MTGCTTQLSFESIAPLPVTVDFAGGNLTPDSGLLLMRQLEDRMGLVRDLTACIPDRRDATRVRHGIFGLLLQRVLQIVGGYDADHVGNDCFTYAVTDGVVTSGSATVTVAISATMRVTSTAAHEGWLLESTEGSFHLLPHFPRFPQRPAITVYYK
jgi:hypothetical protein